MLLRVIKRVSPTLPKLNWPCTFGKNPGCSVDHAYRMFNVSFAATKVPLWATTVAYNPCIVEKAGVS